MLKLFGINRDPEPVLPDDTLSPASHLLRGKTVFQTQAGIPTSADGLAYDPVQRLLAVSTSSGNCQLQSTESCVQTASAVVMQVSTSDGRIKVLGQEGVEGLLISALLEPAATQQLLFVQNRGGLVRLDQVC
jgi:hypothetical protein